MVSICSCLKKKYIKEKIFGFVFFYSVFSFFFPLP